MVTPKSVLCEHKYAYTIILAIVINQIIKSKAIVFSCFMTFENGLPHSLSIYMYVLKNSLQMIYFYSLVNCVWHLFMLAAGSIMHGNLRLLDMYQTAVEKMHGGRVFLM